MDYQKVYDRLILSAQSKNRAKLPKDHKDYVYYESHHIIPRCMNGTDDKSNLVLLTAREHYIAHKLLVNANPNNSSLFYAWFAMTRSCNGQERTFVNSKDYDKIKRILSDETSKRNKRLISEGKWRTYEKGTWTKERTEKARAKFKENNPMSNPEVAKKTSNALREKYKKEDHHWKGRKHSKETLEKLKGNNAGSKNYFYGKSILPWNTTVYLDGKKTNLKFVKDLFKTDLETLTEYIRTVLGWCDAKHGIQLKTNKLGGFIS